MKDDETLSKKMRIFKEGEEIWTDGTQEIFLSKDVKEFIKDLKEVINLPHPKEFLWTSEMIHFQIDKLAGKDLI